MDIRNLRTHWAIVLGCSVGCSSGSTVTPGDTTPPGVELSTRVNRDVVELRSVASDPDGPITSHRLLLNGMLIRTSTTTEIVVTDTVLPGGTHTLVAEASSAGGTSTRSWPFTVRAVVPPTASPIHVTALEAGSVTFEMRTITTGENNRTFTFDPPANLRVESFGTQTRLSAVSTPGVPADDFVGTAELPYTVSDVNGSAESLITIEFLPQPDITFSEVVDVLGMARPDLKIKLSLNSIAYEIEPGVRVQARSGSNTWAFWDQGGVHDYTGLVVGGQGELPLNFSLQTATQVFEGADLTAKLVVIPFDFGVPNSACAFQQREVYPGIPADTTTVMHFIVHTQGSPGRAPIPVGSTSFLRWREAFDSLVIEEQEEAALMNRPPRTLIFTTDIEEPAATITTARYPAGRPAAGQLWVFDSIMPEGFHPEWFGGRNYISESAHDMLSATAWASPTASVDRRRLALARWHDRAITSFSNPEGCTRHTSPQTAGPVNASRTPFEWSMLLELHRLADRIFGETGDGYFNYRGIVPIYP